eukprot:5281959-Pyramimonas_sp.AAC.1
MRRHATSPRPRIHWSTQACDAAWGSDSEVPRSDLPLCSPRGRRGPAATLDGGITEAKVLAVSALTPPLPLLLSFAGLCGYRLRLLLSSSYIADRAPREFPPPRLH